MDPVRIRYRMALDDGTVHSFELELDGRTLELKKSPEAKLPVWTRLDFCKCPNCPLTAVTHHHCPAATALLPLTVAAGTLASHAPVDLEVTTVERTVVKRTTVQRAFGSLVGLVVATSGCPLARPLRPMARFHLPLAGEDETLYRATSMYLLGQYFRRLRGEAVDLDLAGLKAIYEQLSVANAALVRRLRLATEEDGAPNAVVLMDLLGRAVPFSIDEKLAALAHLFDDASRC